MEEELLYNTVSKIYFQCRGKGGKPWPRLRARSGIRGRWPHRDSLSPQSISRAPRQEGEGTCQAPAPRLGLGEAGGQKGASPDRSGAACQWESRDQEDSSEKETGERGSWGVAEMPRT